MHEGIGRRLQGEIYARGAYGHKPTVPTEPERLYEAAKHVMTPEAWNYVSGSAGQHKTDAANQAAFEKYPIVPRMLRDVRQRSLGVNLFGEQYASPLLFAPIGVLEMAHPKAEIAVAEAARALRMPMVLSTQGSTPMEVTAAALGDSPMWYQLYWSNNDALARSLVTRAEKAGAKAIVVTLDTHHLGWRTRDLDLGFLPFIKAMGIAQYVTDPVFTDLIDERVAANVPSIAPKQKTTLAAFWTLMSIVGHYPGRWIDNLVSPRPRAAVETFLDVFPCPHLTWSDLAKLREWTKLPIVVKGIQCAEDARLAIEAGVDAISVSNHGGRQVDGAIASLDALEEIAREVGGKVPLIFDSGIRSGSDIFKALALGADAVMVGRPWLYGLAIDGAAGAQAVMGRLLAELDLTMALSGIDNVSKIDRSALRMPPGTAMLERQDEKDKQDK